MIASVGKMVARLQELQLFFVVGAAKSGTTWLQKMLNTHPEIACSGESHFANALLPGLERLLLAQNETISEKNMMLDAQQDAFPFCSYADVQKVAAVALGSQLEKLVTTDRIQIVGEKTPNHVRHMRVLSQLFPTARFVHIVRDGRDAAVSGWFHILRHSPEWAAAHYPRFADYVKVYADVWCGDILAANQFFLEHPDNCLQIRYEDLLRTPAKIARELLSFLGASTSQLEVDACVREACFEKLSGGRARGEENPNSHFRKGVSSDWRNHFDAECEAIFDSIAGLVLKKLGYLSFSDTMSAVD